MTFMLLLVVIAGQAVNAWLQVRQIRILEAGQREATRPRHPSYAPQTERPVDLGPSAAQQHLAWYDAQHAVYEPQRHDEQMIRPFQRPEA